MSQSDASARFGQLSLELSDLFNTLVDTGRTGELDNERLGQLFAALVRAYAEKVQNGEPARPFGSNSAPSATDVAIVCTALMDAVQMELFELGGWQTMSGLGRIVRESGEEDETTIARPA